MLSGNKKGEVQGMVMTFLMVGIIITGIGFWFAGLATSYPNQINTTGEYSDVMNNATAIYGQVHGIQTETEGMREAPDTQTGLTGAGNIVAIVLGLVNFVQSFMFSLARMTGLPIDWAVPFVVTMATVGIAFAVINWLRGGSRGL